MNKNSLLFLLFSLLMCYTQQSFAQNNSGVINLIPKDTTICPDLTITLRGQFATDASNLQSDDQFAPEIVNIGFPFVFFGQTYTQCVVSGNNFLSFDVSNAGMGSSYIWSSAKSSGQLKNSILFPFHDTNLGVGGALRYQTFGVAPNRILVVEFCKVPLFSCNTMLVTDQCILYEGTNVIEHHIGEKPMGCAWQGGTAIQGLIGNNGAIEIYVPGRGLPNTQWGATQDGRRFTPNGVNTYIIDTIPYNPRVIVPDVDSSNIQWFEEGNPISIGSGASINVTPTANINYYLAKITGQNGCLGLSTYTFIDTVYINYGTAYDTVDVEICAGTTYNWFGKQIFNVGNYDTLLKTQMGCDSFLRTRLYVNPLPDVTLKGTKNVEICEGSATMLALANPSNNNTYQWYKDGYPIAGETSYQYSANSAGLYYCVATSNKGCVSTSDAFKLNVNPNPKAEIEALSSDKLCVFDSLTIMAKPGNSYEYRWEPSKVFRPVHGDAEGRIVTGIFNDPSTLVSLTVYNQYGCYDSDSVMVNAVPCCEVFMPNAFSPNGDGMNDYFKPMLEPGQIITSLRVFDRYGKMVYDNSNVKMGWNGSYPNGDLADNGVYMYHMTYTCADGKKYDKKESVTLIR
jgi:gliding motility-associated-like protein